MKHVFVETNFLVSLLRPNPTTDALRLFERNDGMNLRLYIPWCCRSEARRTLTGIVDADLGFTGTMMRYGTRRWLADRSSFDKREIDKLRAFAEADRHEAIRTLDDRINSTVARMTRIDPSDAVIERTLQVFTVKALKPFDEMVLGAVLAKATELSTAGERDLVLCNLDRDFAESHPPLALEYAACGLTVREDFDVPE